MKEHVIYKKCIYRCIAVRHARRSVNCMVRKKRETEIVCSFHGISIICRLQVDFIFTQMRNNCCVSCLRNAIRPKTSFHVTRDISSEREFRCCLHISVSLRKSSQTRAQGTNKQIVHLNMY